MNDTFEEIEIDTGSLHTLLTLNLTPISFCENRPYLNVFNFRIVDSKLVVSTTDGSVLLRNYATLEALPAKYDKVNEKSTRFFNSLSLEPKDIIVWLNNIKPLFKMKHASLMTTIRTDGKVVVFETRKTTYQAPDNPRRDIADSTEITMSGDQSFPNVDRAVDGRQGETITDFFVQVESMLSYAKAFKDYTRPSTLSSVILHENDKDDFGKITFNTASSFIHNRGACERGDSLTSATTIPVRFTLAPKDNVYLCAFKNNQLYRIMKGLAPWRWNNEMRVVVSSDSKPIQIFIKGDSRFNAVYAIMNLAEGSR